MKIIIGLGNPGKKYERTRHNLGFRVINKLALKKNIKISKRAFRTYTGQGTIAGKHIMLVKPLTYMNNSGITIKNIRDYFNESNNNLLIICDDFQMSLGKIRIKRQGSSGGHNGLESVITRLGTDKFSRLRIGIGNPVGQDPMEFVLKNFTRPEETKIKPAITRAAEAVLVWLDDGIEKCMNKFN